MKKNYILCACTAVALMFASCQKEGPAADQSNPDLPNQEEQTPDAPAGDMSVITATTSATKVTTLDGVNMLWDKGDKIQLYTRTWYLKDGDDKPNDHAEWCDYNSSIESPNPTATFVRDEANTYTVDNTSGKYFAIYKKGAEWTTQSRDYYTQIALDKELVVKNGGDFASTIMYATSEGSQFTFSHAVSYLKFTVDQNTTPFTKLTVSSVSDAKKVITRVKISWNDEDPVVEILSGNSQDSKTITLTTDDEAAFAPGTYYFAINPGTYVDGFELSFENATQQVASVNTPANVEMEAGDVANLGTIGTLEFADAPDPLQLATVYEENGKKQGVVFWIDPDDPYKGKVISVSSDAMKFTDELIWKVKINSQTDGLANWEQFNASEVYTANKEKFYALQYCAGLRETLGGNWYLPATYEFQTISMGYYGLTGAPSNGTECRSANSASKAKFDAALSLLGETSTRASLDGDADGDGESGDNGFGAADGVTYWTSKINTGGAVQYATIGIYSFSNNSKDFTKTFYVRCVRDVEIQ